MKQQRKQRRGLNRNTDPTFILQIDLSDVCYRADRNLVKKGWTLVELWLEGRCLDRNKQSLSCLLRLCVLFAVCPFSPPVPSNAAQACHILIAQRGTPGLGDKCLKAPQLVLERSLLERGLLVVSRKPTVC